MELVGHAVRFLVFEVFFNVLDQKMEPQVSVKCMNQGRNLNCSLLNGRSWALAAVRKAGRISRCRDPVFAQSKWLIGIDTDGFGDSSFGDSIFN